MNFLDSIQDWNPQFNCWVDSNGFPMPPEEERISVWQPEYVTSLLPPFLTEKAQIENLLSINGLSIEEIEARARPGKYSQAGFIGEKESFKEVLRKDWETVEKFHVTHAELTAHLKNIISIALRAEKSLSIARRAEKSSKKIYDEDPYIIEYRTHDLTGNTIQSERPQNLKVWLNGTKGCQRDLFQPKEDSQRNVDTRETWSDEHTVENPTNGVVLHLNSGILNYIYNFGFYEGGGDQNRYRVDPLKILALLTGKSLEELRLNKEII